MSNYLNELNAAEPSITITPTPLIMEKVGESFRGLYFGMQSFQKTNAQTGNTDTIPVAHFYDGEGIRFNMGAQLTRAMQMLKPGISVEIKLVELKANNKGGKTKIYSVTPLKIAMVNLEEMFGGVLSISAPSAEHLLPAPVIVDNDDTDELTAAGIPRKSDTDKKPDAVTEFWSLVKEINMSKEDARAMLANVNGDFAVAVSMLEGK